MSGPTTYRNKSSLKVRMGTFGRCGGRLEVDEGLVASCCKQVVYMWHCIMERWVLLVGSLCYFL